MHLNRRTFGAYALSVAGGATTVTVARAEDFPNRAIRFICPYAAGGLTDVITRAYAKRLSERIGQPVLVDNRTGASGIIGMEAVAKSPADGYTIALVAQGLASVNPTLYPSLPYNTQRDFVPISHIANFSLVLVGNADAPPATFADFVAMAKAKPGSVTYGSAGNASTSHLITEMLKARLGITAVHIPFRGEAQVFPELMGGRLTVTFATTGGAISLIQSGKLRPLAMATKSRSKLLPQVPTLGELGVHDFDVPGWYGILAPSATPKPIAERLTQEFIAISREPAMQEAMLARGIDLVGSSQAEFGQLISTDTERWKKVIGQAGIKPD
ncbi:tripartite tricarboxylate transporter substrate binding protein [Xylophilus sp. GOD-11R]|uniref:Bug family tripartite tricarboxylate transporter substrate binding protein n=1 Tax=Xylophilus sp. GOD-11R TaxID=3089814 RepID=UPI00298CFC66|nr:tripartite tricarboxylate transporter substrate binding protein [Xylophilus sp. GOD-11R]WPB55865.1 tripartite tricarboxylate transporter substrate binding protein [Xylophilus sp. GOD-11R]